MYYELLRGSKNSIPIRLDFNYTSSFGLGGLVQNLNGHYPINYVLILVFTAFSMIWQYLHEIILILRVEQNILKESTVYFYIMYYFTKNI